MEFPLGELTAPFCLFGNVVFRGRLISLLSEQLRSAGQVADIAHGGLYVVQDVVDYEEEMVPQDGDEARLRVNNEFFEDIFHIGFLSLGGHALEAYPEASRI